MPTQYQIDAPLTEFVQASFAGQRGWVAQSAAIPRVLVDKVSDTYHKLNTKLIAANTTLDLRHTPGASYLRGNLTDTTSNFVVLERGYEAATPTSRVQNADFSLDAADAMMAATQLVGAREASYQSLLQTSGNFANNTTLTGTDQWSDDASNPKTDVQLAIRTIRTATNNSPGLFRISMNEAVFNRVQMHPLVRDQYKYTSSEFTDEQIMARYFGVDRIVVATSVKDTAAMGQDASLSVFWTDSVSVFKVQDPASRFSDQFATEFNWNEGLMGDSLETPDANPWGIRIERYVEQARKVRILRAVDWYVLEQPNTSNGYIIIDTLA